MRTAVLERVAGRPLASVATAPREVALPRLPVEVPVSLPLVAVAPHWLAERDEAQRREAERIHAEEERERRRRERELAAHQEMQRAVHTRD